MGVVKIAKFFQALTYWPIFGALKIFTDYTVVGQENLKGLENKAIIFASNHASYFDGPISAACMPRKGFYPKNFFPVRFLSLKEFFGWKNRFGFPLSVLTALYVRINGSVPVEKAGGDLKKVLNNSIIALKNKDKLWIYPEGRRSLDGKLQKGKRGVVFLHKETGAPIVPVAIIGNHNLSSASRFLLRKNKIRMVVGKPIYLDNNLSLDEGVNIIMKKIAKCLANNLNNDTGKDSF